MAHVMISRMRGGVLIPLLLARLGEQRAATLARDIAHHSGQRRQGEADDGDIWIEVDAGLTHLPPAPVVFPVGLAGAPLVAIGVYGTLLTELLADATVAMRDTELPRLRLLASQVAE